MQDRSWFKFVLKLNENDISLSEVRFPADPENDPMGKKVHVFLLKLGLYKQNSIPGVSDEVLYVFNDKSYEGKDPLKIKNGLLKIHNKLKPMGAQLVISNKQKIAKPDVVEPVSDSVSRAEFEALKKQSAIADKELLELQQRLQDLSS